MRRILVAVIVVFLILSAKVTADDEIINFPDPYFKKILVNMEYCGQPIIDLNKDGEIQYSEAAAYDDRLWFYCEGTDSITDFTGIKEFINLKKLWLNTCTEIREIDLSGMVNLEEIKLVRVYHLEKVNISGCKNLGSIICDDNNIKYLNAENCTKLISISSIKNPMEDINLIGCRNLRTLSNTEGNLSKINIKDCLLLEGIALQNNKLTELDLSILKYLKTIYCENNQIKEIDVSNSNVFKNLRAFNNQLKKVNLRNGNNKAITAFKTFGNPDLKCITVDDPAYSKENWKEIDEWTEFSEDCSNGVNDNPQNQFKVFPNPSNNSVLIERIGIEAADLRILDMAGRICLSHPIQYGETQVQIDISSLSAGKYIIEINNETENMIVE